MKDIHLFPPRGAAEATPRNSDGGDAQDDAPLVDQRLDLRHRVFRGWPP
jgi:hypothetical protein